MGKRFKLMVLLVLTAVLAVVFVIAVQELSNREPVVHGRPLSHWSEGLFLLWADEDEQLEIEAAYSEMNEDCVLWLTRRLYWRPSKLKDYLNRISRRFRGKELFKYEWDPRAPTAHALGKFGKRAKAAVPALEYLAQDDDHFNRATAKAALIKIRNDPLLPWLESLKDSDNTNWLEAAEIMGALGADAAPSVPLLVQRMQQADDRSAQKKALFYLSCIHSHPEITIPAIASLLRATNRFDSRFSALLALKHWGSKARSVLPEVTNLFGDDDNGVRWAASNAVREIDPITAQSWGISTNL